MWPHVSYGRDRKPSWTKSKILIIFANFTKLNSKFVTSYFFTLSAYECKQAFLSLNIKNTILPQNSSSVSRKGPQLAWPPPWELEEKASPPPPGHPFVPDVWTQQYPPKPNWTPLMRPWLPKPPVRGVSRSYRLSMSGFGPRTMAPSIFRGKICELILNKE